MSQYRLDRSHRRVLALGTVLLVAYANGGHAQQNVIPVQTGLVLEHDTVAVGDVVRLAIRVRAPLGATINFPAAVDSLGAVQALAPPTVSSGSDSATYADRIATYRMSAWDIGKQQIKLGEVLVQTDDGERRIALSLPELFVRSVLPEDTTLRVPKPARPLLDIPAATPWWWWAIAAAVALVLILTAWWWRRRNRARGDTGDPYADANAAFARVDRLRLIEAGETGSHAALMTDIVRRYLAGRFEAAALSNTGRELFVAVRPVPSVPHDALLRLLEAVEPVKFGAAPLSADGARAIGDEAKAIVRDEHERAAALAAAAAAEPAERAA